MPDVLIPGALGRLPAHGSNAPTTARIPMYLPSTGRISYVTPDQIASGASAVDGPASATDNAIARFDGATGKLIQNSAVTVADTTGAIAITGTGGVTVTGTTNQLVLGTTATTTINAVAPAASRVLSIRDAGASGSFVVGGGNAAVTLTGTGATSTGTMTTLSARVTTAALTTAGQATHVATITYTGIAATDIVLATLAGGTNTTESLVLRAVCTANTITVGITNATAATAVNGTIIFNLLVVKV
jgi:hypothetical protein|tara:strand:+ start:8156 stop:8890 length:735 start_codon:yes stop_codon:yes gene_type:complete